MLPLLRRTFGTFTSPERRLIGERLRHDARPAVAVEEELDDERGSLVLPRVSWLLGGES